MLKYVRTDIVFQEIPNETSLAVAISGCTIRCSGCHSRYLWEDTGEPLDVEALCGLLNQNSGITCLLLMGGERDIDALTELFMYAHKRVKTAWYCGLDCPTTNQRLYQFNHLFSDCTILGAGWRDITHEFWKHEVQ